MLSNISPTTPARYGPTVCAIAKTTVNKLIEKAHRRSGRFFRVKFVMAPGAINTEMPNIAAETISPPNPDDTIGILDPIAMQVKMTESGTPLSNFAKTGFQTKGDRHMQTPSRTQINAIDRALIDCDTIHAERNVK